MEGRASRPSSRGGDARHSTGKRMPATVMIMWSAARSQALSSRRIQYRAARPVLGADFHQRRELNSAGVDAVQAARLEGASRWKLSDGRDGAFDGRERKSAVGLECGNRAQQALRVGMTGGVKNIRLRAELDQAAGVHDRDAIGYVRDDGEIVRDEEHRQSEFMAEVVEQVEDLLLDSDVERGGGFVGDEQLRAVDNGHGDHDALAHASGELVRITAGALVGIGNGNVAHAFNSSTARFRFGDAVVREDGFRDLLADAHDRVERGHGLLENHGHARPAKLAQLIGRQVGQMRGGTVVFLKTILKSDFAPDDGGGWKQAHDGKRGNGFPGARFAD